MARSAGPPRAGTSGRLAASDAGEVPGVKSIKRRMVLAIIQQLLSSHSTLTDRHATNSNSIYVLCLARSPAVREQHARQACNPTPATGLRYSSTNSPSGQDQEISSWIFLDCKLNFHISYPLSFVSKTSHLPDLQSCMARITPPPKENAKLT